ncbi:MAG: CYTH domain-containing protein [Tenericutes bacterium]|nr:CYTH domain-containing protein [Mycoplasmatota bacterium]
MEKEIELRVYDIDKEELIKKIEKLNGKFINNYEQIRYVYDFNPVKENKWIRLRTDGFKTTLTIKEYTSSKINGVNELEIEVSDMEKTNLILEKLGYKKRSVQENKRTRYILNDVEIDIDTWPYLKTFVEFESKSKEKIYDVLKLLDIDIKNTTTKIADDFYYDIGFTKEMLNDLRFKEE